MIFTSFSFLLFLGVTIICYFVIPVRFRWIVLLLASVIFYGIADIRFLPYILVTTLVTYSVARLIHRQHISCANKVKELTDKGEIKKCKESSKKKCRAIVTAAIVMVVGYLCYTKFAGYVLDWISDRELPIAIIVPLGISYYTFSTVGYVLDVYWKRYEPEKNFFKFLLYVIYFPHILQGPIARYDRLGVQFFEEHRFDYKRVCLGMQLIIWGFFQKLVIADRVGIFVSTVYDNYKTQCGSILLLATIFYAVQIYTDFSGCVNIARGASQIFGIELEENFRQPYFSRSVDEFWRRWHMTLGAWFKDYLCMPVSVSNFVKDASKSARKKWGSRAGKNVTTIAALIVVWISTGIWHGTGLNYIVWAIWQGGIIIISVLLEPYYETAKAKFKIKEASFGWKAFQVARTFLLTGIIPRVIVRASSLGTAGIIFKNMFWDFEISALFNGTLLNFGLAKRNLAIVACSIIILIVVAVLKEKGISIREKIAEQNIIIRWGIYIVAIFSIAIVGIYGPGYDASAFVYMGF